MAAQDPGGGCREQFGSGVPSEVRGRALILLGMGKQWKPLQDLQVHDAV